MTACTGPRVAVVVLGFNDEQNLPVALRSLRAQDYPAFRAIFVDNASTDLSLQLVRSEFPEVDVIAMPSNQGYAGAYSEVLPQVFERGFDCAVLLNTDVELEGSWLKELVSTAYSRESIGFAQPKILMWDGVRINSFGNHIQYLGFGYCGHCEQPDHPGFADDVETAFVSGASMLVKREAYNDVGGIDASFFAYCEDQDLVWRGRIRGWRCVSSAASRMRHRYQFINTGRGSRKMFLYERNRLAFVLKNYSCLLLALICPALAAMECVVLLHALANGYLCDKLRSYRDIFTALPSLLGRRREVQSRRRIPDASLLCWLDRSIKFPGLRAQHALAAVNWIFGSYFRWFVAPLMQLLSRP